MSHTCTCHYCNSPAALVGGDVIYPHRQDLADLKFWHCDHCDAYVGCHKKGARVGKTISDGTLPLGRLANKELRFWKSKAHGEFDPMWRDTGMSRNTAYRWLANKMGLHHDNCHIGDFTVEQCKQVVDLCKPENDKRNQAAIEREWNARWGRGMA